MNKDKFHFWLRQNGAEVLAPTNPFELARFRARGGVHIIYEGRRGITANGFGAECISAFQSGRSISMGITKKPRTQLSRMKAALMERDGDCCFFCGLQMIADEVTVEHLISLHKGGPNHMDNFVLAHEACNQEAANLPLVQKIKLRDKARGFEKKP